MNEFLRKFDTIRFVAPWSIFRNFLRIFHFFEFNFEFWIWAGLVPAQTGPVPTGFVNPAAGSLLLQSILDLETGATIIFRAQPQNSETAHSFRHGSISARRHVGSEIFRYILCTRRQATDCRIFRWLRGEGKKDWWTEPAEWRLIN